jgi:hypothetical protein
VAAQGATARIPIEVGNNHVDNLRVTPVAPFKISGRLVVENPAAGTTTDFRNLRLVLVSDPDIAGIAGGSATATPSPEGVFTVSIQPGRYRAFAQPLFNPAQLAAPLPKAFENVYLRSIRLGATDVLADGLSISTAPEGQLEVVLGVSGSVSGMVTSEGRPVVNATVVLIPDVFRTRRDLYRVAKTDGSGKYQIKGVPPGGFKAFAWIDAREGQWYDPEFVRDSEGHGSPIQVSEGIATAADLPVVVR